ncbi:MAG: T9SS type A sorting domain-containing protein [Lewinellaceae bacterium]|nr:T9SS type A sorting domain-containing protein [Lewinellaceae bacterium]
MKTSAAIIAPLLTLFQALHSQTPYHPMLVQGRTWDVFDTPPELEPCPYTAAWQAFIAGDTAIGGKQYRKIAYHPINAAILFPWCGEFYLDTTTTVFPGFFLREDSLERKVWYLDNDPGSEEFVLFDFSLQVGDTLKYPSGLEYVIAEISDVTLANGTSRRQFKVSDFLWDNAYIEGIGYTYGPFNQVYYPFEGWEITTCVRDGDEVLYHNVEDCVQTPYPDTFAPPGSIWYYTQPVLNTPVEYTYTTIEVVGDTLIDGESWRIVQSGDELCSLHRGYLRQNNHLVYYRSAAPDATASLLYDFGLQAGESYITFAGGFPMTVTADSVGTSFISGQPLQTWYVHTDPPYWNGQIVEKAGHTGYLIPVYGGCDPLPGPVRCYFSDTLALKWVDYPCDTSFTLPTNEPDLSSGAYVFPNPFEDRLYIHIPDAKGFGPLVFELYDISGIRLIRHEMERTTTVVPVEIPALPPGVYCWKVIGKASGKVLKYP